jgi:Tol biopolymer transport system component
MRNKTSFLAVAVLGAMLCFGQSADTKRAQSLMQAAQTKETVSGDLKAAIELYRQAARSAGADRALAAQALLRVGDCQERLGQTEARKTYEQIVRDYGDQPEWAARARAKLAPAAATAAMSLRSSAPAAQGCMPQPIGARIADCYRPAGIFVRDLQTGAERLVVPQSRTQGRLIPGSISPDEKTITYFDNSSGLRAVGADGANDRLLSKGGFDTGDAYVPLLHGLWSKDGKHLALIERVPDGMSLVSISIADGATRTLLKIEADTVAGAVLSPDEKYVALRARLKGKDLGILIFPLAGGDAARIESQGAGVFRLAGWHPSGRLLYMSDRQGGSQGIWAVRMEQGKPAGEPEFVHGGLHPQTRPWVGRDGAIHYEDWGGDSLVQTAALDVASGRLTGLRSSTQLFANGNWSPAYSPDGKKMVYASAYAPATVKFVVKDLASGEEMSYAAPYRTVGQVHWDADGESLLVFALRDLGSENMLYRFTPATGESKVVSATASSRPSARGGQDLYFAERNATPGTLRRLNLATGELSGMTLPAPALAIAVSGDGAQVAYGVMTPARTVKLAMAPMSGGPERVLYELPMARMRSGAAMQWTADGRSLIYSQPNDEGGADLWLASAAGGAPVKLHSLEADVLRIEIHPNGARSLWPRVSAAAARSG